MAQKEEGRRSSSIMMILLTVVFFLSALAAVGGGLWMIRNLPIMAAQRFGPSGPGVIGMSRLMLAYRLLDGESDLLRPVSQVGQGEKQEFIIEVNETASQVSRRLELSGLIRSAEMFDYFMVYSGLDISIQAGVYELSPEMSALEIAAALQDATPSHIEFGILEGWRLEEVAASLPSSGLQIDAEEFLRAAYNPDPAWLPSGIYPPTTLEGYLLPGVYSIPRDATLDVLITVLTEAFEERVTPEIIAAYQQQGLSLSEGITLASIVEREAVVADEQAMIAAVFINRLKLGMKLESDPTTQYALGYDAENQTWWKNPLSEADLSIDSVYNTYVYGGLPPGPICSADMSALEAVADPAADQLESKTPYLYFRSACDGSGQHRFAVTFEEHLLNACP